MSLFSGAEWNNTRLVAECLRGNEQAWHALVDRYKNLIFSIPIRFGTPHQDAADIFQAVCLDLFNELPRLRDVDALQGWLIRVTTHKCYHWRRQQLRGGSEWNDSEVEQQVADQPIPPDMLAELEKEQMIREAVDTLPARCRLMIELLFFEHPPLPYTEVAERLKLARGSIGFIRGRCLKRLKKALEEKGF